MNAAEITKKLADNDMLIQQLMAKSRMATASDNSHADFDAIQSRADEALIAHGKRAGPPLLGESAHLFRVRLCEQLKKFAPRWADFPISGVRADAFERIENEIYQDAATAAKNPIVAEGELRCIPGETYGGHKTYTYHGEPRTWMDPIAGPVRQYVRAFKGMA